MSFSVALKQLNYSILRIYDGRDRYMHGWIIQVRRVIRETVFQQAWGRDGTLVTTEILLIVDNFSSLSGLTVLRHENEADERQRDTVLQPHAYLIFPLSHPSLISQYRILAAWWLGVASWISGPEWTRGHWLSPRLTDISSTRRCLHVHG